MSTVYFCGGSLIEFIAGCVGRPASKCDIQWSLISSSNIWCACLKTGAACQHFLGREDTHVFRQVFQNCGSNFPWICFAGSWPIQGGFRSALRSGKDHGNLSFTSGRGLGHGWAQLISTPGDEWQPFNMHAIEVQDRLRRGPN